MRGQLLSRSAILFLGGTILLITASCLNSSSSTEHPSALPSELELNSPNTTFTEHGTVYAVHSVATFCIISMTNIDVLVLLPRDFIPSHMDTGASEFNTSCEALLNQPITATGHHAVVPKTTDTLAVDSVYGALRYCLFQEGRITNAAQYPEQIPYFEVLSYSLK